MRFGGTHTRTQGQAGSCWGTTMSGEMVIPGLRFAGTHTGGSSGRKHTRLHFEVVQHIWLGLVQPGGLFFSGSSA